MIQNGSINDCEKKQRQSAAIKIIYTYLSTNAIITYHLYYSDNINYS